MKKIYKTIYICIIFFVVTASLKAQCTFTTSAPYFEGFNGITTASPLPQCWSALSQAATSTTPVNKYAYFYYTPAGANYFFTQGVQLNSGVNYSVSVWHIINNTGTSNWTNLSILLGTSQTTTGLTTLATTPGAASSPVWVALTNTFNVSSSGLYYFVIRGTSNGLLNATHLFLDDFEVNIPCSLNTPLNLNILSSNVPLCSGQNATLMATGANSYTWSNGAISPSIVVSSNLIGSYSVIGSDSLTGCLNSVMIPVYPSSTLAINSTSSDVCIGNSATLTTVSSNGLVNWSTGHIGNNIIVSPTVSTSYSATVLNAYGCSTTVVQSINVMPVPTIAYFVASNFICAGDQVSISFVGAQNYSWYNNLATASGSSNLITKQFAANELLIVTGIDNNGCSRTFTLNLNVNECTGFNENSLAKGLFLFPNPATSHLEITGLNNLTIFELFDLSGNIVISSKVNEEHTKLDLSNLTKGIYFLKIKSGDEVLMKKIVKE